MQPNGTVVPNTIYSTPASVVLFRAFLHLWLAERSDVVGVNVDPVTLAPIPLVPGQPVFLPVGIVQQQLATTPLIIPRLAGEYRLATCFLSNRAYRRC